MDALKMFDIIYTFASRQCKEIFGGSGALAREAFRRSIARDIMPGLWFEIPLLGKPRFDLHVTYGNEELHEGAPFPQSAADDHGVLLNWYASKERGGAGLALAYDAGDGRIGQPAVHANVEGADEFDAEGFFSCLGRPDAAEFLMRFLRRVPPEWKLWYFGLHPGRPGTPVRVDFFANSMKDVYAKNPALFAEHLSRAGVEASTDTLRVAGAIFISPFDIELQFDVPENGKSGPTVGISAGFDMESVAEARRHFANEDGDASRLMAFAEEMGMADGRWHHAARSFFARGNEDGDGMRVIVCVPKFVKFRVRDGIPMDAKVYLSAWTHHRK